LIQDIVLLNKSFLHFAFSSLLLFIGALFITLLFIPTLSYAKNADTDTDAAYGKGAYYFSKEDYKNAFKTWLPLANKDDPAAQYSVALLYDQGNGVKKNKGKALKYLQLAVNQDLPDAQYYLAMKYYYGLDIGKNDLKARNLLIKAAKQDNLKAQFQLANLYDKGEGGKVDQRQATYWFKTAAENGYGPAQHSLAARFLTGKGTPVNIDRGVFWLKKAANQDDSDAQRDLGFMYYKGIGVDKNYKKARDLLAIPAEENSAMALFLLGEIYAHGGYGVTKDAYRAKKEYKKAQKLGYAQAKEAIRKLSTQQVASNKATQKASSQKASSSKQSITTSTPSTTNTSSTPIVRLKPVRVNIDANAQSFQQINDNYYTLQLLSSHNYRGVRALTYKYYDKQTYMLETPRNKNGSYLLSYGAYKNYSEAKQAIQSLPKAFQLSSKPWIRQIKSIKAIQYSDNTNEMVQQSKPTNKPINTPQPNTHIAKTSSQSKSQSKDVSIEVNASDFQQSNNTYYTVQLLSSKNHSSITKLTDNFLDQQTYILATPKNERASYLLTYGLYKNYNEAKQAIKQLPEIFQLSSEPWIRKVKEIKKLMANN